MKNSQDEVCPLKYLLKILGGKWKIPIICILAGDEPKRYSVIKRRLKNITDIMLSQSLRELENDELVNRTQYNEVPPRVEYSLTEKGRSTIPILTIASEWALKEMNEKSICKSCEKCLLI